VVGVRLENLVKRFGKVTAVDHINLEIRDGEFVVLLGPSGCGKTTTLRLIAGLELPDEGRVLFGDRDVTYLPPRERNISMVFQSYAVWPHMTVYENIAFPMRIRKVPEDEIKRKVRWAAQLLQIEDLLDRYPHQLSGGQRQRVAVARAIVVEPDVLLMDEPLSNLDALLRVVMRSELKKLQRRLNVTTIYVTHDQVEAMVMADRVAVMRSGRIQQVGTPQEVYDKPANVFVAGFIGSPRMNLFPASVVERDGAILLDAGGLEVKLPADMAEALRRAGPPGEVIAGIRPEDIHPTDRVPPGVEPYEVEGKVDFVEPLGSDTIVHVETSGPVILMKVPGSFPVRMGDEIRVVLNLRKLHVFEKSSEKAIF